MSPEVTKELIEIAGPIFPPLPIDPRQNLMCFGFDCGDGWKKILHECFAALRVLKEHGIAPNLGLMQVKEKFGTLRVYLYGEDPYEIAFAVASHAEHRSSNTCEDCGDYGTRRGGGWIRTLCDKCCGVEEDQEDSDESAS